MKRRLVALLAALLPISCDNESEALPQPSLKAEMIVHAAKGQFLVGCDTEDLAKQAVDHAVAGEATKLQGMMASADCVSIPTDMDYKILSVDQSSGLLEFKGANSDATYGLWTAIETMAPGGQNGDRANHH